MRDKWRWERLNQQKALPFYWPREVSYRRHRQALFTTPNSSVPAYSSPPPPPSFIIFSLPETIGQLHRSGRWMMSTRFGNWAVIELRWSQSNSNKWTWKWRERWMQTKQSITTITTASWYQLISNRFPLQGQRKIIYFKLNFYYNMIRDSLGWWPGKKPFPIFWKMRKIRQLVKREVK